MSLARGHSRQDIRLVGGRRCRVGDSSAAGHTRNAGYEVADRKRAEISCNIEVLVDS